MIVGFPLAAIIFYFTYLETTVFIEAICLLVLIMCWFEFLPLVMPSRVPRLFYWGGAVVLVALFLVGVHAPDYFGVGLSIGAGVMFMMNLRDYIAAIKSNDMPSGRLARLIPIVAAPMGMIYILTLTMYLPKIHELPSGNVLLGLFFCGVWACDVGAYFSGRLFGKVLLSPEISPKKTWEGLIGGVLFSLCWILLFRFTWAPYLRWYDIVLLLVVVGPISQLGDLAESLLKRAVDKKDAGNILPGHGGMLDRIDAYLLSAPLFYLYVSLRFGAGTVV
jgi:phosphatidate cytidylyltransferase